MKCCYFLFTSHIRSRILVIIHPLNTIYRLWTAVIHFRLDPYHTARQVPVTCLALPRVFTYTVTRRALLCSYHVISGEGCVSLVMVNWSSLLLLPEALHTTGTFLTHTTIFGTCHARHVPGKISVALIVTGMCLAWHVSSLIPCQTIAEKY